jgi:ribosome-associated translation inhibitor RaiA
VLNHITVAPKAVVRDVRHRDSRIDDRDAICRAQKVGVTTMEPIQISFRNMDVSPALEEEVRSRVAWLDPFYPGILGCRVVLEIPHRHRRRGRRLHVRIELSLPGEDVVVNHEPSPDTAARSASRKSDEVDSRHKDAYVVIHEAFDVARRRLEDVARRRRGDVKTRTAVT